MSKVILPTDFKDDLLNAQVNTMRKYKMIQNSDGTVSFLDMTAYDQIGSEIGALEVNETNKAINARVDEAQVLDTMEEIMAVTEPGFVAGALALKQQNSDNRWTLFGTATALNQQIAMPTVPYREILAIDNMNGSMYSILIPAAEIKEAATDWSTGMHNGAAGAQFQITVSAAVIFVARSRYGSAEQSSIYTFYYR